MRIKDIPLMASITNDSGIPGTYALQFGRLSARRGMLEKAKLFSWDVIPKCPIPPPEAEEGHPVLPSCPAIQLCDFEKSTHEKEVKCGVTTQYLRGTAEMLFNNFANLLSEDDFYRLGMHLMPLYRMLVKLKIAELGIQSAITTTDRGIIRANPVYKEIRETIKSIESMWGNLQLSGPNKRKGISKPKPSASGDLDMTPEQDFREPGSYYEAMASGKLKTEAQLEQEQRKRKKEQEKGKLKLRE